TADSYPGKTFFGLVSFIFPHLDEKTRTEKVRIELPNPDLRFKPGMYVNAGMAIPLGRKLVVPASAVLHTGDKDIVFVGKGNGFMEIRGVTLGHEVGNQYEVLGGLSEGERVVTAANFLIDAESQVQGAIATWQSGTKQGTNKW
ncbi:MAG: efflux RND transporter periplasmic adaptor subunit, partial [Blastocatellia bacterium]